MNLGRGFWKAIAAMGEIGSQFIVAKSELSEGGTKIVTSELIDVGAAATKVWVKEEGLEMEISADRLIQAYEKQGFIITK